ALQAAWPLLVQAAPARVALVPVCSTDGVTHYQEVPVRPASEKDPSAHASGHCAVCPLAGERPTLAGHRLPAFDLQETSSKPPVAPTAVPSEPPLPHQARPRAPPFLPLALSIDQLRRNNEKGTALLERPAGAPLFERR